MKNQFSTELLDEIIHVSPAAGVESGRMLWSFDGGRRDFAKLAAMQCGSMFWSDGYGKKLGNIRRSLLQL